MAKHKSSKIKYRLLLIKLALGLLFCGSILLLKSSQVTLMGDIFSPGFSRGKVELLLLGLGLMVGLAANPFDKVVLFEWYQSRLEWRGSLVTQSLIFILAIIPTGFFVITSTSSPLGLGLVMGLLFSTSVELISLRDQPKLFSKVFLDQLKRPLSDLEIRYFALGYGGVVGLLWLMALL